MKKSLLALAMIGALSACGGGDSVTIPMPSPAPAPAPVLVGQLVDGAVANVSYSTSSGLSGKTDANGNYSWRAGDTIRFSIGKIVLGESLARALLTPIDLVGGATTLDNPNVVKILQVLQTLDDDLDPGNGIRITDAVVARLAALGSEINIRDITDLVASVITPAFAGAAGTAPVLKTADAARLHFATTLGFLEASSQISQMGGVSNFVIGGGNRNCSSFNGDSKSANCSADWATILAQDPAFAGLSKANISFDSTYAIPEFRFSITQANIDKFVASPAGLFDATRKAALVTALNARLAAVAVKTNLAFSDFDGSKPLFADGSVLWNTALSNNDFDKLLITMCGSASPANGADCNLSDASISAVQGATFESSANRDQSVAVLRALQTKYGSGLIKYRRDAGGATVTPNFRAEFQALKVAADGSQVQAGLTLDLKAAEKAILRSAFVDANPQINRKVEARTTKFLSDKSSFDIHTQFVAAAKAANGGKTPTIGVVTASAENAFADRDINVFMLKSAGANVVYLPMEGGFRKALDANDCASTRFYYDSYANTNASGNSYNMDQAFPDLAQQQTDFCANGAATLNSTLQGLNAIYFSGGDQSRHLESFVSKDANSNYTVTSPQLAILKARFDKGELVVAGTSAGNHVQNGGTWKGKPVPMIGGGDSYASLKSGFVKGNGPLPASDLSAVSYANGGLGFFKYGVLDSHFTRRTREGRLVRHTAESGMDYGFGVDENTSLVVGKPDAAGSTPFSVIGAGGVFIIDVRGATASGAATGNFSISGVKTHFLTAGDSARIDAAGNLTVTLASTKPLLPLVSTQPTVKQTRVQDYGSSNFLTLARNTGLKGAMTGFGTTEDSTDGVQNSPLYSAVLTRSATTSFRGISNGNVSYTNVMLNIAPCAAACTAP